MLLCGLLFLLLLTNDLHAQSISCACSCCRSYTVGQPCTPITLPAVPIASQYCVLETCLERCSTTYFQCQVTTAVDRITAECFLNNTITSAPPLPPFNCRCDCCNTVSSTCLPLFVGNTRAYSCTPAACSIACEQQYPSQCKSGQTGITQGACTDIIPTTTASTTTTTTITTTTTTTDSWLGNACKCTSYQSNVCGLTSTLGVTSASSCSTDACTQACRNRYPVPLNAGTFGTCISDIGAKTFCNCECCENNKCIEYRINTNESCTQCRAICRENSPCTRIAQVLLQSCNHSPILFSYINVIFIIFVSSFFYFLLR